MVSSPPFLPSFVNSFAAFTDKEDAKELNGENKNYSRKGDVSCVWEVSGDKDGLLFWPKFFSWP